MASKYDKNLINIFTFSYNLKILHTKSCFERKTTYILAIYIKPIHIKASLLLDSRRRILWHLQ